MSETLILGGGLAGGAAALLLAESGHAVRLLERDAEPCDKICGEFVSVEARRDLERLGLDLSRMGAVAIDRLRLIAGERTVETALPFPALGISRKLLDEALLERAAAAGAKIERGVRAGALAQGEVSTSAGTRSAARVMIATGKHSLRGARLTERAGPSGYVGFKMHWWIGPAQQERVGSAIELVLFDGGYAGMQRVAADVLNLCLVLRRDSLAEAGGGWDGVLARMLREPGIARRLGDAHPLFAQPLTIADLPYGYVCRPAPDMPDTVYRLGDQAAMTASLTGDGMALALRSARLAAESLRDDFGAARYHARLAAAVSGQVRRAMLLQRATEARWTREAGFALLRLWPRLLGRLASATRLA